MARPQADYSDERFQQAGEALSHLDACIQGYRDVQVNLKGFSVRNPQERGGEYLLTLRGTDMNNDPVVAFHGSYSLPELWIGAWNRFSNGDLKWKEDTWAR